MIDKNNSVLLEAVKLSKMNGLDAVHSAALMDYAMAIADGKNVAVVAGIGNEVMNNPSYLGGSQPSKVLQSAAVLCNIRGAEVADEYAQAFGHSDPQPSDEHYVDPNMRQIEELHGNDSSNVRRMAMLDSLNGSRRTLVQAAIKVEVDALAVGNKVYNDEFKAMVEGGMKHDEARGFAAHKAGWVHGEVPKHDISESAKLALAFTVLKNDGVVPKDCVGAATDVIAEIEAIKNDV